MAVTPVGNPYVESSDRVSDYPGASEALAERIDVVGVNPFADSAARATAIPTPVEGQMASLNDDDRVYRYSGSAWVVVGTSPLSGTAAVATEQSTTSTSYVDLATSGPAVTLVTGTKALVMWSSFSYLGTTTNEYARTSIAVSGATTVAASDSYWTTPYIVNGGTRPFTTNAYVFTGLTAGSNTFTMKYKTDVGNAMVFGFRRINVVDMGS